MPRVFVCTPTHYLQGGAERTLEALAKHLPARGFEVLFGLARGERFHDPDAFRRAFPDVRGVDVDGTRGTAYGRRRALRKAILAADPDVVLFARMFETYPVASELKLRGHRLRLASLVASYESDYFADLGRWGAFVDAVVTSGELTANAVRELTPVEFAVSIPGGIAPPRRTRVPHDGPLRLGYAGRLEQMQKRILDLPLLCAELERRGIPFTLDVAGAGSLEAELRARLPHARHHGWLSTGELYERVYPELDVFVHFAEWEGTTIAPREAQVHGVVPVVSRFTGNEDFFHEHNALTFPVGDVAAAADAIERLHRDRALLERLARAARTSQSGPRSEEGAIDLWAETFRTILARPARVGATLPQPPRDSGRLTRLGVPEAIAELVRHHRHAGPGGEWPHWSGMRDEEMERRFTEFARRSS